MIEERCILNRWGLSRSMLYILPAPKVAVRIAC